MTDDDKTSDPLAVLSEHAGGTAVAPAHGVAAIALSMAMKYHDIGTVQDGALYQQYKLEGKNLVPLHLDMVFDTAEKMERWLLASSERVAKIIVDALEFHVEDHPDDPETAAEGLQEEVGQGRLQEEEGPEDQGEGLGRGGPERRE